MFVKESHSRLKRGRRLNLTETAALAPYFCVELLNSVILHEGRVPWWLLRRFAAVTLRTHIYTRAGAYQPDTVDGLELLAHEITHVQQFANGMTYLKYLWSSIRGYANSVYEREACSNAANIRRRYDA